MRRPSGTEAGTRSASHRVEQDVGSIFKRTEIIGRGKFGVVYKGYHSRTKQVFAIKVLNLDSDEDEVEDVQREVQFLASMKQVPNITQYYGSYLKDTTLWIIIEYCAGGSLRTLLRPGKIDEKYIGVIMRELLIALKFIHRDNVIHRDLKAANVLITNDGQVKLCDFGVAAQLNQSNSRRHTMAGTPYWMAPEVIMEGVYYDTKVDIWSLGITTYEAATGNPPYCEVEALRAMQLITKSKPPRLEGRSYSPLLKEFIALCLDEDPKERLSAEELLKTKFIKAHKATPTTLLKQLISRYLLFRDNNKSARESIFLPDDYQKVDEKKPEKDETSGEKTQDDTKDADVDVKWDFDSLSSSDYIMENDIDMEEIPEGCNNDWTSPQHDRYNYAYPEEDQFYYYPTNPNGKIFQGTTMGKTQQGTMVQNTTLNAPLSRTNNFTSKLAKSGRTNPTASTGTYKNSTGTNKKPEARLPKKLLELFETNEVISEEASTDPELPRMNRNLSHLHMGSLPEDSVSQPISDVNAKRPPAHLINNGAFHSQSTPALPVLQTKFSKSVKGPPSAVTTAPTPIEIEIPEELPTSTIPTPSSTEAITGLQTKPRSSTVSTPGPVPYQKGPGLSRRLTVGTAAGTAATSRVGEEQTKKINNGTSTNFESSVPPAVKYLTDTPSPHKLYSSHVTSPTRRLGNSPTGGTAPPPMMKAMGNHGDNKEPFLQPLNTTTNSNSEVINSKPDKETSRVNRDFKRNNPNLKLQMPLPTTVAPHKLLDPPTVAATANNSNAAPELINQFGFNTSTASNIPVSMTPINEKHIDWGTKPKRVHSISNRKNSQTVDGITSTLASGSLSNGANAVQAPLAMNQGPLSSSSVNVASMFSTNNVSANNIPASNSQPSLVPQASSATVVTTNSNANANTVTSAVAPTNTLMQPPPATLNMDLFIDVDTGAMDSNRWTDKKPRVLQELEALLQMFEEGLPVIENALKKQLKSDELVAADH